LSLISFLSQTFYRKKSGKKLCGEYGCHAFHVGFKAITPLQTQSHKLFSYLHSFIFLISSIHSQRKKIKEKSKWPCKCRPPFTLQDYHLLPLPPSDHSPIHLLSSHLSFLVPLTFYFILINYKLLMDLPGLPCV